MVATSLQGISPLQLWWTFKMPPWTSLWLSQYPLINRSQWLSLALRTSEFATGSLLHMVTSLPFPLLISSLNSIPTIFNKTGKIKSVMISSLPPWLHWKCPSETGPNIYWNSTAFSGILLLSLKQQLCITISKHISMMDWTDWRNAWRASQASEHKDGCLAWSVTPF